MEEINEKKLDEIKGGGLSVWGAITIITGVIFLVGVVDGFVRPLSCNK